MKRRRIIPVITTLLLVFGLCAGGYAVYDGGRPAPIPMKRRLYEGVTYRRVVRYLPRFMIVHLVEIDLKAGGVQLFVTAPDRPGDETPLDARTTSQFLEETGARIAINGDGFQPWWSRSPADYYPHGDPVALGVSAARTRIYCAWTGGRSETCMTSAGAMRSHSIKYPAGSTTPCPGIGCC
jgi:hypothetical protein